MARVNATGGTGFAVDNGTGLQVRTKLQQVIDALRSLQSGSGDPTVGLGAYQLHVNEVSNTSQILKIRNKANNGFVEIGDVAQTNLGLLLRAGGVMTGVLGTSTGSTSAPSFHFGDTGTGLYKKGTNQIGLVANQAEISFLDQNGLTVNNQKEIRFSEQTGNGTNYVGLKAGSDISSSFTFTLPTADGTSGQFLKTNGSGVLSFASTQNITPAVEVNQRTGDFTTFQNSYQTVMSVTITPNSNSSKLLVIAGGGFQGERGDDETEDADARVQLFRGSTAIGTLSSIEGNTNGFYLVNKDTNNHGGNAVTYHLKIKRHSGNALARVHQGASLQVQEII
tara:strand:- start:46 stop:1056 length:1011 start_codon:yes stop_codon:yes gene_type:complete